MQEKGVRGGAPTPALSMRGCAPPIIEVIPDQGDRS